MPATASNTNVVLSAAAAAAAVGEDATWINAWNAATGGDSLGRQDISTNPGVIVLDARYRFAIGALVFTQPEGVGETNHLSERSVRGKVEGGVWVSYHNGDPGPNGTANLISGIARTAIAAADFTFART